MREECYSCDICLGKIPSGSHPVGIDGGDYCETCVALFIGDLIKALNRAGKIPVLGEISTWPLRKEMMEALRLGFIALTTLPPEAEPAERTPT